MTSRARSEMVIGADPEGPPRHFCSPAETMSSSHSSVSRVLPAMEAVAST
jgi:hypothetical protein